MCRSKGKIQSFSFHLTDDEFISFSTTVTFPFASSKRVTDALPQGYTFLVKFVKGMVAENQNLAA